MPRLLTRWLSSGNRRRSTALEPIGADSVRLVRKTWSSFATMRRIGKQWAGGSYARLPCAANARTIHEIVSSAAARARIPPRKRIGVRCYRAGYQSKFTQWMLSSERN